MLRSALLALSIIFSGNAVASTARIDVTVGEYKGKWCIDQKCYIGDQRRIEVQTGLRKIWISGSDFFAINVPRLGEGYITILNGSKAARRVAFNWIEFETVEIFVEGSEFREFVEGGENAGGWTIEGVGSYHTGNHGPITLVRDISYNMIVAGSDRFRFRVSTNSNVEILNGSKAAAGGLGRIVFNTVNFYVDAGDYFGRWAIERVGGYHTGNNQYQLVQDISYNMIVAGSDRFRFKISTNSNVEILNGSTAAVGGLGQITFQTTGLSVDAGDYDGGWAIERVGGYHTGSSPAPWPLVRDITYRLKVAGVDGFLFRIGSTGNVTSKNGIAATGGQNELKFNNAVAIFSPTHRTYPDQAVSWNLEHVKKATGADGAIVVPNIIYRVYSDDKETYVRIGSECSLKNIDFKIAEHKFRVFYYDRKC